MRKVISVVFGAPRIPLRNCLWAFVCFSSLASMAKDPRKRIARAYVMRDEENRGVGGLNEAFRALPDCEEIKDPGCSGEAYYFIATTFKASSEDFSKWYLGKRADPYPPEGAEKYYLDKSIAEFKLVNDPDKLIEFAYKLRGWDDSRVYGLNEAYRALDICAAAKNHDCMGEAYYYIGQSFKRMQEKYYRSYLQGLLDPIPPEGPSIYYLNKSIEEYRITGNLLTIARATFEIGNVHGLEGKTKQMCDEFKSTQDLYKQGKIKSPNVHINMFNGYTDFGEMVDKYYDKYCKNSVTSVSAPATSPESKGPASPAFDANVVVKEYEVEVPPKLLSHADPVYPDTARMQGLEGKVFMEVMVNETGVVTDARVLRSENAVFDDAARNAVLQWRYSSPMNHGHPVRVYKNVTIVFAIH